METRFLNIKGASDRYGGTPSAWRKWVRLGLLGGAVVRFGRLVMLDSTTLDRRLSETHQLLVSKPAKASAQASDGNQR